jgi:DNA-binding transcriptional MerR regulator
MKLIVGGARAQKNRAASGAGTPAAEIPDKLYFRIGEVSRLAGVPAYVLRYWETEFPGLSPKKSGTGQRLYRRKEVELVLEIKRLLYDHRFTIEGARRALEARGLNVPPPPPSKADQSSLFDPRTEILEEIRRELAALRDLLAQE